MEVKETIVNDKLHCSYSDKNVRNFFILLVFCGLIIAIITPPFAIPDENTHFLNAYSISRGDIFPDYYSDYNVVGKYYPQYVMDFVNYYNGRFTGNYEQKITFSELYFLSWLEVADTGRYGVLYSKDTMAINPISYFFVSIGLVLGNTLIGIFGTNLDTAYNLLLISRLSNLIVYCLIGSFAVVRSPCLKRVMMLILANPTSLYCSASASYDAIVLPVTMLFAAEILYIMLNKESAIEVEDITIVMFCVFFMVAVKIAYAPFLLLLLFIPVSKYKSKKQYLWCVTGVLVSSFIGGVLPSILSASHLEGHSIREVHEEISIQKEYIVSHMYLVPSLLGNSFQKMGGFYLASFLGKLGILDTNYPVPFLILLLIGLLFITVVDASKAGELLIRFKVATLLAIITVITGMFVYMYIIWTPLVEGPMGDYVTGIQGRYFTPIYCFVAMIFASNSFYTLPQTAMRLIDSSSDYMFYFLLFMQPISVVILLVLRYWV